MEYSLLEINEIEAYYNIKLPFVYKRMMMLIGTKILNNLPSQTTYYRSIYRVQEKMKSLTKEIEDDGYLWKYEGIMSHGLEKAFFITNCVKHDNNIEHDKIYFIEPKEQNDCPVYAWIYNGYSAEISIDKSSDGIEEWLLEISCALHVELQFKKIFHRSRFL
jgi:hypothetical protein